MSNVRCLVFDTNTLISHLLLPDSLPARAVRKGLHEGQIIASDDTLSELADVLSRSKFDRYISIEDRQEFFRYFGRIVNTVEIIRSIKKCRDPRDDKFLELAVNGRASHIITGDKDLLVMNPFKAVQIINPEQFLNL